MSRVQGWNGAGVLALWLALVALPAAADPCASGLGRSLGPLQVGLREGELGLARRACAVSELALGGEGNLVADLANFYGNLRGAVRLSGSYALGENTEFFGSLESFRYQTVISSISAESAGLGHLSLGATHRLLSLESFTVAATGRLVLPTATGMYRHILPFGLDAAVIAEQALGTRWRLHAQAGLLASAAISDLDSQPRLGAAITAGAGWQALEWLSVVADLHASAAYAAPLDVLALGLGVRAGGEHLGAELAGILPVAGLRSPTSVMLRATWRF
jgi:hypothetical protein